MSNWVIGCRGHFSALPHIHTPAEMQSSGLGGNYGRMREEEQVVRLGRTDAEIRQGKRAREMENTKGDTVPKTEGTQHATGQRKCITDMQFKMQDKRGKEMKG